MTESTASSYVPKHFEIQAREAQFALITANSFGLLIVSGATGLRLSHLPFIADPARGANGHLRCHVARANPIWREVAAADQLVAVFGGPHAYISPDWYDTPARVPTWDYTAAYVQGRARLMDDAETVTLLEDLSRVTEEALRPKQPWTLDKLPEAHFAALRSAIVGIDIAIESIVGKSKMEQNRTAADQAGATAALRAMGGDQRCAVADLIEAAGKG